MEHFWKDIEKGKPKYSEKDQSPCYLSITNRKVTGTSQILSPWVKYPSILILMRFCSKYLKEKGYLKNLGINNITLDFKI
jgi:hypothetical protein